MTKPTYFLAIDNGTQSIRAMIFDQQGTLVAKSKVDIEAYSAPQPGWAEQEAEYFWSVLCAGLQPTLAYAGFPPGRN